MTDSPTAPDAILQRLVSLLVEKSESRLTPEMIDVQEHMYDCGYVDSLSAAAFLKGVEMEFGVRVKESQLVGNLDHLQALAAHIRENL